MEWQSHVWASLLVRADALPHAMLLIGKAGVGKVAFAEAFAARLLCEKATGIEPACGACEGCRLLASGNHPDFRKVGLEEEEAGEETEEVPAKASKSKKKSAAPSTQIKIHQIRALEDFVYVGSHRQGARVVVISPAEAMNVAATNALLKILEEPPASVYFILISSNDKRLLPTLRSRCRQIAFGVPAATTAQRWLKTKKLPKPDQLLALAGGAPLQALKLGEEGVAEAIFEAVLPLHQGSIEPLALAAHWDALRRKHVAFALEALVDAVQKSIYDLARVGNGCSPRYFTGNENDFAATAARTTKARLNRCYADLLKIRAVARHPLNELLFLEDMAARCASALAPAGRTR